MEVTSVHCEGIGELLEKVENAPFVGVQKTSQESRSKDWDNGIGWKGAIKLAKEGWPEGVERISKFVDLFESVLGSKLKIDEYFYDVTGQDFDLDRVLLGEPEAWLNTEQVEVIAPAQHTISIFLNHVVPSGTPASVVERRGAAILALTSLLQRSRRNVEIVVGGFQDGYNHFDWFQHTICLKKANQNIDMSILAFALVHPAFFRRLIFRLEEVCWPRLHKMTGYGRTIEMPNPKQWDIYCGNIIDNRSFLSNESTEKWILNNLKAQGVELREEGVQR